MDFDETQLAADFAGILSYSGVSFDYRGTTVTGVWTPLGEDLNPFEEQRREVIRYNVFSTVSQFTVTPRTAMTVARRGITYFVDRVSVDAEGVGFDMDVSKVI